MEKNLHWISTCRLGVGNTFCLYGVNCSAEPGLWLLLARCSSLLFLCVLFLLGIWIPYTTFHQFISNYFSLLRALQIDLRNYFLLVEVLAKVLLRKRIWEEPQLLLYTVIYMHTHTHTSRVGGKPTLNVETHLRSCSSLPLPEIAFIRFVYCHQLFIHTIILSPRTRRCLLSFPLRCSPTCHLTLTASSNDP